MTFFENILKKRLGDATSTKGVAPDDLWAEIEQGLPPEEEIISPVNWGKISLTLLGLFLALAVSFSLVLREKKIEVPAIIAIESINKKPLTSIERTTVQVLEKEEKAQGVSASEVEGLVSANEESHQHLQDGLSTADLLDSSVRVLGTKTERDAHETLTAHQAANSLVPPIEEYEAVDKAPVVEGNRSEVVGIDKSLNSSPLTTENDTKAGSIGIKTTVTTSADASEAVELRNTTAVRKLNFELLITGLVVANKDVVVENFKSITLIKQLHRPRAEIGIFVGSNILRHKYPSTGADDLADVLNATQGEALGQSVALEFGYRLRPGLKVYTGVELLKTHTTFRYTEKWDTVTTRNGQQVDAIATRRVQHNNRQTLLSVPLMLEKTFASGRWEAGLAAGISFNYLSQQTGRSLNAFQQVVTYSNGGGNDLPAPNFYLSYQLRPSINYRLNNRMSIQARVDLRWQRYGKSALYELSANSMLYGGSFGLVFGL